MKEPGFAQGFVSTLVPLIQAKQQRQQQAELLALRKKEVQLDEQKFKLEEEKQARAAEAMKRQLALLGQVMGQGGQAGGLPTLPGAEAAAPEAPGMAPAAAPTLDASAAPTPDAAPAAPSAPLASPAALSGPAPLPAAPSAPGAVQGPPGAPQPSMRFVPDVSFSATGGLSLNFRGQPTQFQVSYQTVQDPQTGRSVLVQSVFDPQRGVVVQRQPIGLPAEPEQLQRAGAIVQGLGVAPTHPLYQHVRNQFLLIESLPTDAKGPALEQFTREVRAMPPAPVGVGPGGAPAVDVPGAIATGRQREIAQGAAKVRAEETARREESPLSGPNAQKVQLLGEAERQLLDARVIFQKTPQVVGKTWLPFKAALTEEVRRAAGEANAEKYVPGALASRMRQFLGTATPEEVVFRRHILDSLDILLRARSGAAIQQSEFTRLQAAFFDFTDEPTTFGPSLDRAITSVGAQLTNTYRTATTGAAQALREREAAMASPAAPALPPPARDGGRSQQPSPGAAGQAPIREKVVGGRRFLNIDGQWVEYQP